MHKQFWMLLFWFLLLLVIIAYARFAYWEITKTDVINAPTTNESIEKVSIPPVTENTPLISNKIYDNSPTDTSNPMSPNNDTLTSNTVAKDWRWTRITQTEDEHIKQWNGSMYAIDIVWDWNSYFPDRYKEYFVVHIGKDERLWDYIIIRHDKERWVYWHTQTTRQAGDSIHTEKDWKVLGQYNTSWMSQWPHYHIERWICPSRESKMWECQNVSSEWTVAPRNRQLIEQRGWWEVQGSKEEVRHSEGKGIKASTEIKVIACLNEKDMTIHDTNKGNCFLWNWWKWKNIMLPPQKDIDKFKEIFGDDYKYRLAIANFEGSFKEDAGNPYAYWYLQTLRSYKIPPDITSQLNWLAKREIGTTGRICDLNNNAPYWWDTKLDRYTCMARWHFGFHKKDSKHYSHWIMYWKRYRVTTEYYLSLDI